MDRQMEKTELILKLGLLLHPLQDIVDHPERQDAESRSRAAAKFNADLLQFDQAVRTFVRSEPGLQYETEEQVARNALYSLKGDLVHHLHAPQAFGPVLKQRADTITTAIQAIPITSEVQIFEAASPFSTYCKIKDICQGATSRLVLVDRYLDATVFYRYLQDVPPHVSVTLVTWPLDKRKSPDRPAFLDISRLYATERGPDSYRLIVHTQTHDRWLYCDNQWWQLGGSFKDAGAASYTTLSALAASDENLQKVQSLIDTGTELYGPGHPAHP